MKRQFFTLTAVAMFFVGIASCPALAGQIVETAGVISQVTVYRGQAQVTRTIETDLPAETSQIIAGSLPEKIVPESLYAQGAAGVEVLSVSYRERPIEKEASEEVKKLDDQIAEVQRQLKHTDRDRQHGGNLWGFYLPFWNLTKDTTNKDFDRGLLQAEPMINMTGYLEEKFNKLHQNALELEDQIDDLKKNLDQLQRQRNDLTAGQPTTLREALIYVRPTGGQKAAIQLSYLVNEASWQPQYNLRAHPDKASVTVEYSALVRQLTGEDWNDAAVSLSTAQPATVAAPPVLEPMQIRVAPGPSVISKMEQQPLPPGAAVSQQQAVQQGPMNVAQKLSSLESSRREISGKGKAGTIALNRLAYTGQMLELQADKEAVQMIQKRAKEIARTEGISVTYNLPGKLSLPSRSDKQLVAIDSFSGKGDFYLLATPLLTDYVYLQADIANTGKTILLAGPANMYRGDEFAGQGEVPLVTIGQTFTAGFGVDSQIQVAREFKEKKAETLWGNRVEDYQYRIAISNYRSSPAKLRLLDRLPYTEDARLDISDFKTDTPLSKDAEYLRTLRDKGILRWDLDLAPATFKQKATVVNYSFTIKYDKDMHIQNNY